MRVMASVCACVIVGCTSTGTNDPGGADAVAEACVALVSCGAGFDGTAQDGDYQLFGYLDDFGSLYYQCTRYYRLNLPQLEIGDVDAQVSCAREASSCDAVLACRGEARTEECSGEERCEGDRVVSCNTITGIERSYDCAAIDQTCVAEAGRPRCRPRCAFGEPPRCDGDVWVVCGLTSMRCGEGTTCTPDRGCVGTGPSCTTDFCDGNVRVFCAGGQEGGRVDCTERGTTCIPDANAQPCEPNIEGCTEARCEGGSISICGVDNQTILACPEGLACTTTAEGAECS